VEKGAGGLYIHNDKKVVIEVTTHAEGVALSIGVQEIKIQMVDEK
jgi:ribosomal protein L24E